MSSPDLEKFRDRKRARSRDDELSDVAQEHGPEIAAMLDRLIDDPSWRDKAQYRPHAPTADGARDGRGRIKRGSALEVPSAGKTAPKRLGRDNPDEADNR